MGKGGDAAALRAASGPEEVLIDGALYDVRDFKHPGGSIVKFLANGGDATDAFREFHGRSEYAQKVLQSLPKREAKGVPAERLHNGKAELAKDFAALRAELQRDGFFEPAPGEIAYRVLEVVAMHALGASLFLSAGADCMGACAGCAAACKLAGLVVLGLASGRCGWLMHEGGHYSLTGRIDLDRMLQIFLYGVGCGMSGMYWRNQHNKHHATPQKLGHDVDLETLPLVAFNEAVATKVRSPVLKAWLRLQAVLFIPVSCLLVALGWQYYQHPNHMLRILRSRKAPKGYPRQAAMELASLAVRHVLLYGLFRGYSYGASIGMFLFYDFCAASYIFTNFALSHTHLPATKADEYLHWVEYAAKHTTNLAPNPLTNWWMAYLNFQIEHHLFPSMPQFRHPQTAERVKVLFAKHGLHYDVRPYFSCLYDTLLNLHNVGRAVSAKAA